MTDDMFWKFTEQLLVHEHNHRPSSLDSLKHPFSWDWNS